MRLERKFKNINQLKPYGKLQLLAILGLSLIQLQETGQKETNGIEICQFESNYKKFYFLKVSRPFSRGHPMFRQPERLMIKK